jgi:hemolysin III
MAVAFRARTWHALTMPRAHDLVEAVKPRWRGVSHQYAFFVSLAAGPALVGFARSGRAVVAALVYAVSLSALLGVSALYHRGDWTAHVNRRLQRLDHSMIYLLIAGTYTPIAMLALSGRLATALVTIVWAGALAGIALKLAWRDAPRWLGPVLYVVLGWVAVAALPQITAEVGPRATALLALGGVLYSVGAVVYGLRRPDPVPAVFGYHEVFHLLVIGAALSHYTAIAVYVIPRS